MLPCQRELFDLPDDVAYLRCAATAPQLNAVHEAGQQALALRCHPWLRDEAREGEAIDALRARFGRLIGAGGDDIAIVPAASYGLSIAAANIALAPGDRIVTLASQFPSNVYPWRTRAAETGADLVHVARPPDGDWTPAVLAALDDRVRVAALPNCHWTDGGMLDLRAISARVREIGAALVLDLSQSIGAIPFDVAEIRPDYAVSVGQKWLMGPHQLAYFYVAPGHQEGRPIEFNWVTRANSDDSSQLVVYSDEFQNGAKRFDGGARGNPVPIPMANAALEQIEAWGVATIQATIRPLVGEIAERAGALGLEPTPAAVRAPHMIGLRAPGGLPAGLAKALGDGGVYVSIRGDAIRIAPHVYNRAADIDRLFEVLARLGVQ